eukprot:6123446-Prymnesium_polylepis.1
MGVLPHLPVLHVHLTVVGKEDDERVIVHARAARRVEHLPHQVVRLGDHRVVRAPHEENGLIRKVAVDRLGRRHVSVVRVERAQVAPARRVGAHRRLIDRLEPRT